LLPAGAPLARSSGAWLLRDSRLVCSPFRSALCPPLPFRLPVGGSPSLPARFELVWPLLTSRSALVGASPFQAQGEISPGKDGGVPRTVAGSTSLAFGRESSRSIVRFPWLTPPRIRRTPTLGGGASCSSARGSCSPLLSAPASRPDRSPGFFALRFARGRCDQLPPGFSPVHHLHAGHTTKPLRGRGEAGVLTSAEEVQSGIRPARWLRPAL
jgi:hypothetical protein